MHKLYWLSFSICAFHPRQTTISSSSEMCFLPPTQLHNGTGVRRRRYPPRLH